MTFNSAILQEGARDGRLSWKAAAFLKKVTDIVPSVIYVFNQQTQSNEYSNKSLSTSMGYSAQEAQQMGENLVPLLAHPDDLPRIIAHFTALQSLPDGEIAQLEYRLRHKAGHWVWLLSHDTVFERDANGRVLRHIGVAADISAQKQAEEHAHNEHRKAQATNEELREFSYSMSHDMKSPSSTLHLLLNELLESHGDTLNEDAASLVYMALTTVTRMSKIVDDVLHYTRIVNQDLEIDRVDLTQLMQEVLSSLQGPVDKEKAKITLHPLPHVRADKMQLRVMFENLLQNALKFHKPGCPPHIEISAGPQTENGDIPITVADDGIGIDPAKHDQIFSIFKRLNAENDYPGTGLGLAISRRIAVNHQRKITLQSQQGAGAAFTIGFPKA